MAYLLDQDTIDFIQSSEVALCLATSDTLRMPRATRAFCCKVSADAGSITTWIPSNGNAALLTNINNNGRLALVVCHVQSLRAIQFKAVDARVQPIGSDDYSHVLAYQQGFVCKTVSMGYPEDVMRTHVQIRVDQMAAIQFTPHTAFMQTPGPKAGTAFVAGN